MSTEPPHLVPVPIRLRGYRKHFDGQRMLEPVDLDIAVGETVALLGPSGRGKAITLRIVVGLEASNAGGIVHFGGEDVTARLIERRHVGMVLQSCALFLSLSARGNVECDLHIQRRQNGLSDAQISTRANTPLEMMHLMPYADRGVTQLSGRWRQCMVLARTLAPEPRALLLDKPLTAFDAKLHESVHAEIDRLLRGPGTTAIYVMHDQEETMALADRIVIIEVGHIVQTDAPREIYFQPVNRHMADSIGIVNRLDGTREDDVFVCVGGHVPVPTDDDNAIFFRPEDTVLAGPAQTALKDTVESALFLGFCTRACVADVSATPLFIDVPGHQQPALGYAVGLDISADRLLTL